MSSFPLTIGLLDSENGSVTDVNDSGNVLTGQINWYDIANRVPSVTGGANLKFVNTKLGPGHWAGAPAVPGSGSPQQNTAWRDAAVTVTGGTVTAIAVDGTTTGVTSGTVTVPAGKNITLTYSSAPTWVWVLS